MAVDPKLLVIKPVDELVEVTGLQDGDLLFYDGSGNLKRISIDTFNNLSKTAKPLKPIDPTPTEEGLYIPTESGTYTNAGGLIAQEGYYTLFFFDGTNWTKSETIISYSNTNSGELINFSENIYFDKQSISITSVSAPINFKPIGNNAKLLGSTLVRLTADGVNVPNFSKFKKINGSQDYVNTNGILNSIFFFYDGFDAWVNIWQGIGSSDIDYSDSTPPTPPTLLVGNISSYSIELIWSGATDNIAVTSYEVYKDNVKINEVSASPFVVTGLTASTSYSFKIKAKDASGNISAFSNTVTQSTITPVVSDVVFDVLSGATYSGGALLSNNADTGGKATSPIIGDFETYTSSPISEASIIMLKDSTSGGYQWTLPSNVEYLIASYIYGGSLRISINSINTPLVAEISTTDTYIKMTRSGNNCLIYTSSNGSTWTLRHTQTNILSGVSNVYLQGVFAISQSNNITLKKSQ